MCSYTPCAALHEVGIKDSVWGTIELYYKLLNGVVYRSPNSSICINDNINTVLQRAYQLSNFTQLLLMGDFNYPEIDWSSSTVIGSDSIPAAVFLNSCEDTF